MINSRSIICAAVLSLIAFPALAQSEEPARLSYSPTTIAEGDSGVRTVNITVTLSRRIPRGFRVNFARNRIPDAFAYNGASVTAEPLDVAANQTTATLRLTVRGTDAYEGINKSFTFQIHLVTYDPPHPYAGPQVESSAFTITLAEDDPIPTLHVSNVRVIEGDAGSKSITATVTATHRGFATFEWRLVSRTATAGSDFAFAGIMFPHPMRNTESYEIGQYPSSVPAPPSIMIHGDTAVEPDETFEIELYN